MGVRERQDAAVSALSAMAFVVNPLSARHCEATALLAARTANRLKLDEATIFRIERIGHIHDIGLTGGDPEMIAMREPLTET